MPTRKGFTRFNEDTRVKIPATLHFLRIGYQYQSLKDADIDFNTKKEDKNAHGWGVKIIREAISTSGGDMEYTKEGTNKICAKIFIPFLSEY